MWVDQGEWGGRVRGGWTDEPGYPASVGGLVRVCERVFSVGLGPGLGSMSSAGSRRSASHAAGTHGRLPQNTGWPGLRRGGVGGYNLHSPPDCGTLITSRLYPFDAITGCLSWHQPHAWNAVSYSPKSYLPSEMYVQIYIQNYYTT